MKLQYSRALILITLLSVTFVPLHAAAKEDNRENRHLQQVKDALPAKVQERVESLRQKAEIFHAKNESKEAEHALQPTPQPQPQNVPETKPVKLPTPNKKVCDENQARITDTITQLNSQRQQVYERIEQIAESADQFYTAHKLSIDNYSALLAATRTAETLAKDAIAAQLNSPSFHCDGESPRAVIQAFQTRNKSSKDALEFYREAVKSLLSTIHETYRVSAIGLGTDS